MHQYSGTYFQTKLTLDLDFEIPNFSLVSSEKKNDLCNQTLRVPVHLFLPLRNCGTTEIWLICAIFGVSSYTLDFEVSGAKSAWNLALLSDLAYCLVQKRDSSSYILCANKKAVANMILLLCWARAPQTIFFIAYSKGRQFGVCGACRISHIEANQG